MSPIPLVEVLNTYASYYYERIQILRSDNRPIRYSHDCNLDLLLSKSNLVLGK